MNALRDFAVFLVELLGEIRYRIRHASARGVWAWLTDGSGLRLIMLIVIIPLILLAEHYHWFR